RHLEGDGTQIDLHQAVDGKGNDEAQARALERHQTAEPEENAALVLVDDADRRAQADQDNENDDAENDQRENAHGSLLASALFLMLRVATYDATCGPSARKDCCCCRGSTRNRSPSAATTRTCVPVSSGPLVEVACQRAPFVKTIPLGFNASRTVPTLPTIDSSPAS